MRKVTSLSFPPSSVLFDKGVIRRVYERRVRLAAGGAPTLLQVEAANAYARIASLTDRLHITEQTANILQRRTPLFAAPLLADLQPLKKGRYLRRWARRLRDSGFSPEDAIILAYGSFGVTADLSSLGVEAIITTDLKLAAKYQDNYVEIERRFEEMVNALAGTYATLSLPQVLTTTEVLAKF
jgi:hypothetical protein